MVLKFIDEAIRVSWADLYYLKRNVISILLAALITPLLYFITFGLGLGDKVQLEDGMEYIAFVIPGIISLSTLTSCFGPTANKIMMQRKFYSNFDEIVLCPVSSSAVVIGKTTAGIIKGLLCGAILLLLGKIIAGDVFNITGELILCMIISCFTFSLLGVVAGFVVNDLPKMNLFTSFVILPMTFLCGTMFPVSELGSLGAVIDILPLTHSSAVIRATAGGLDFPWVSLLIIILYAIFFYLIAYYLLKKGKV